MSPLRHLLRRLRRPPSTPASSRYATPGDISSPTVVHHNSSTKRKSSDDDREVESGCDAAPAPSLAERLVGLAPAGAQPYLRLARYDRPVGALLLYWPCTWGVASAAPPGLPPDPYLLALLGVGALAMRGAGCTVNDLWDRDVDARVRRTAGRPLASGELGAPRALAFLAAQLAAGLAVLLQLNGCAAALAAASGALAVAYPLAKRVTHWPQVVLGAAFGSGALVGAAAARGAVDASVAPLYAACVCWTVVYDTIYALPDREDDQTIGIGSTALRFGGKTRRWLAGFGAAAVAGLVGHGAMAGQTWPYYAAVGAAAVHLAAQIATVNVDSAEDCAEKFASNSQVGFIVLVGIVLGGLLKEEENACKVSKDDKEADSAV